VRLPTGEKGKGPLRPMEKKERAGRGFHPVLGKKERAFPLFTFLGERWRRIRVSINTRDEGGRNADKTGSAVSGVCINPHR